jgi:prefoldin subunit 5
MPMGTPTNRPEPARIPYGDAAGGASSTGGAIGASAAAAASPTMAMPSTEVPRVAAPVVAQQPQVLYDARPADVPVAVESTIVGPPPRKPVWPWVVAVVGVILGGLIGWLLSQSDDDEEAVTTRTDTATTLVTSSVPSDAGVDEQLDALLAQTRANGVYPGGPFPQIDEIIEIDRTAAAESLQNQVDLLSIAQEDSVAEITELEEQVTTLEESLADVTAERDELRAQAESGTISDSEFLARLQEKEDQVAALQDQLDTMAAQVTEAQVAAQRATDDLRVAQADLQRANASLEALDPIAIENYVNGDIARLRSDAAANGWVLVERQVDGVSPTPDVVTNQAPGPGTTVVRGGVVYVEIET